MTNNPQSKYSVLLARLKTEPVDTRIRAIQILLLSELRYLDKSELLILSKKILGNDTFDFNTLEKEIEKYNDVVKPLLDRLGRKIDAIDFTATDRQSYSENVSSKLANLTAQLNEFNQKITEAGRLYDKNCNSIEDAINIFTRFSELHQYAMNNAAEIIIQRLIESFDPEALENYIDNSVIKVGPLKKAALFDAMKDKYEQILMYQKEGKMLRDFKVHYKSELKSLKKDNLG